MRCRLALGQVFAHRCGRGDRSHGLGIVDPIAHPEDHGVGAARCVGVPGVATHGAGAVPEVPVPGRSAGGGVSKLHLLPLRRSRR